MSRATAPTGQDGATGAARSAPDAAINRVFNGGSMDVPVYAGDKPIDVVIRSYQMIAEAAGLPPEVARNFGDYWRAQSGQMDMYHYTAAGKEAVTAEEFAGMQQAGMHTMHLRPEWQPSVVSELRGWLETMGSPADVVVTSNDAVQRGQGASQPIGSQEGFGSFVVGGLAGGFSSNNTWSAIAGQTVVGFVPVAGQLADARDIAAAAGDVYQGEEGGWAGLGIAMVAIIPGLDFLKGGSRAGWRLLTEAAQRELTKVTQEGLQRLGTRLSAEAVEQAEGELRVLAVAREEMLVRLDSLLNNGNLSQNTQGTARTAYNSLRDHFSQNDLIGALQEQNGLPIIINGVNKDHIREVSDTLASLRTARGSIIKDIAGATPGTDQYRLLSQEAEAIQETITRTEGFLRIQ